MASNQLAHIKTIESSKGKPSVDERSVIADQALAERYDALNQSFREAEKTLKALKPLHAVWVDYNHDNSDCRPPCWEILGLIKYGTSWRICHGYDSVDHDEGMCEVKPITECPAEVRVRAASVVRLLHEKIVESKEKYIPKVEDAIAELAAYCNGV